MGNINHLLGCEKGRSVQLDFRRMSAPVQPVARAAGFTLVELIVSIAVVAILMGLGIPSFMQSLRNAEIRNAADAIANGMHRARAEAVSRNANVYFQLGTSTAWTVDYVTKPVSTDPAIDSRLSTEGSVNVTITALAADLATAATKATFNNLGQVVVNADGTSTLNRVNLSSTGGNQSLRVTLGAGGNAKVCDPSLVVNSSPRAC